MNEGYPPHWRHALIHLDPTTGEMHSDGDHYVRHWIEQRLYTQRAKRALQRLRYRIQYALRGR